MKRAPYMSESGNNLYMKGSIYAPWILPSSQPLLPKSLQATENILESFCDGPRIMLARTKRLHHIKHGWPRLLQVKDLLVPTILVSVKLLNSLELLGNLLISLLQLLLHSFLVPFKIGIKTVKLRTILKGLIPLPYEAKHQDIRGKSP